MKNKNFETSTEVNRLKKIMHRMAVDEARTRNRLVVNFVSGFLDGLKRAHSISQEEGVTLDKVKNRLFVLVEDAEKNLGKMLEVLDGKTAKENPNGESENGVDPASDGRVEGGLPRAPECDVRQPEGVEPSDAGVSSLPEEDGNACNDGTHPVVGAGAVT